MKRKTVKKTAKKAAAGLAAVLLASIFNSGGAEAFASDLQPGDVAIFGRYEQNGDTSDGQEKIFWNVLDQQDGRFLLVSEQVLDVREFAQAGDDVTWEQSEMRSWLNGEFLQNAFNETERSQIVTVTNHTPGYAFWDGTVDQPDTQDQVFLLSFEETQQYYGVVQNEQYNPNSRLEADATEYAKQQGASGDAAWWLRSPGYHGFAATCVKGDGSIYDDQPVDQALGVRPAVWITLGGSGETTDSGSQAAA